MKKVKTTLGNSRSTQKEALDSSTKEAALDALRSATGEIAAIGRDLRADNLKQVAQGFQDLASDLERLLLNVFGRKETAEVREALGKARRATFGVERGLGAKGEDDGSVFANLFEQSFFTNIKAAVTEGHKLSAATGVPHYCYGESGKYKISKEKPEAELRYIQITPGGNEWTWSYNPSAEKWTKSRLGMVSESTDGPEWDRVLQLSGIEEG